MSDRVRCRINTDVFIKVENLVVNFCTSIQKIQECVNQYLKDASEDFARQLEAIELRLVEAKEEEKRREEEKYNAKEVWNNARKAIKNAEYDLKTAQDDCDIVRSEKESLKSDCETAYHAKEDAKIQLEEAKEEQQEAYHLMKDHTISHDEFEGYISDTHDAKLDFSEKKAAFDEIRVLYNEKKEAFITAIKQKEEAKRNLNRTKREEIDAKKEYLLAENRHTEAIKLCRIIEANLKDAKETVLTYEGYKSDYFHPYIMGRNKSCDVILTQLRTYMRNEFGKAMAEIEDAVIKILRCSLQDGVSYNSNFNYSSTYNLSNKKSWEQRKRIKEGLSENKVIFNRELKHPKDERPDYAERCKGCGRLISLCNCPRKDAPLSLDE